MWRLIRALLIVTLCVQLYVNAQCNSTTINAELAVHSVEVKFYRAQTSEWNSGDTSAKIAVQVSNTANAYCAANPTACGVTSCCSSSFKDADVIASAGYPQDSLKDLVYKFGLQLPGGLTPTGTPACVVSSNTLSDIIGEARSNIHAETGYWITYIGDEFYGIPPNHQLNQIIIPIACVVIVALIIFIIILHFREKRQQAAEKRKKIRDDRKKQSKAKVNPTYDVDPEISKTDEPLGNKNKDQLYKENLKRSTLTSKTASIHSEDSAIRMDQEPRQRQGYAYERDAPTGGATGTGSQQYGRLQPLQQNPEPESQSPEKKKKKKKKRSKSKENMAGENGSLKDTDVHENQAYEY